MAQFHIFLQVTLKPMFFLNLIGYNRNRKPAKIKLEAKSVLVFLGEKKNWSGINFTICFYFQIFTSKRKSRVGASTLYTPQPTVWCTARPTETRLISPLHTSPAPRPSSQVKSFIHFAWTQALRGNLMPREESSRTRRRKSYLFYSFLWLRWCSS